MKTILAMLFAVGLYAQAPLPTFSGSGGGGGTPVVPGGSPGDPQGNIANVFGPANVTSTNATASGSITLTCTSLMQHFVLTLTGNVTATTLDSSCNPSAGTKYALLSFSIIQGAGGPWTFAWPAGFSNAATIQAIATAETYQMFFWDGATARPLVGTNLGPSTCPEQAAPSGNPATGFIYIWCDSTDHQFEVRNSAGTTIKLAAVGGLTVGQAVSGGGANRVVFEDGSQNVATDANLTYANGQLGLPVGTTSTPPYIVNQVAGGANYCGFVGSSGPGGGNRSVDIVCGSALNNMVSYWSMQANVGSKDGSGNYKCWSSASSASSNGCDTFMLRNVANVMGLGANGNDGWYNSAGETRVTTQFDKTSDVTLANIPGLTSTLIAGRKYRFAADLYTTSNTAGGVQVAIGGTATATSIVYDGFTTNAGVITQSRATTLGAAVGAVTTVTAAHIKIEGTIVCNAAGTLTVQFAQNASNGTASSVLVNSTFQVWDWAN